jgi:hypothetical protein
MVFYISIIILQFAQTILPRQQWGENTLQGGQNYCHIVLFFRGPIFELQPSHYYEGFSQCFCKLW